MRRTCGNAEKPVSAVTSGQFQLQRQQDLVGCNPRLIVCLFVDWQCHFRSMYVGKYSYLFSEYNQTLAHLHSYFMSFCMHWKSELQHHRHLLQFSKQMTQVFKEDKSTGNTSNIQAFCFNVLSHLQSAIHF